MAAIVRFDPFRDIASVNRVLNETVAKVDEVKPRTIAVAEARAA